MADSGSFRSSMGGFNKKDVLAYIDAQQARHAEEAAQMQAELERWRQRCETAETALTEERRSQEALRTAVNTAAEEKQALEKRVELLENAQEDYRRRAPGKPPSGGKAGGTGAAGSGRDGCPAA